MQQSLEGLKVLDLTRVLAGPYSTMVLADLGAEVIKIEVPETGDDTRAFGPFVNEVSAYFMSINRNKRSITLNLKDNEAKEILKELVKKADIIVENFRPGTMEKLGLGYDVLKEVNPKIIYAACSGFGHTGPWSTKPAYDVIVQAAGGIMSITGQVGGPPTRVGASVGDIIAGLFTTIGILAAVNYRTATGIGQKVDVAMLDGQVAILENAIARYYVTGKSPVPMGNRHPSIVPFEDFKTKTINVIIAVANDSLWAKYCKVVGREELITDPRFATAPKRSDNHAQLKPILDEIFMQKTAEEWIKEIEGAGIPCGTINRIEDVVNHPQVLARNMIVEVDHPVAGKTKFANNPIKLSETPAEVRTHAPLLGQDNEAVLYEYLGYSAEKVAELKEKGVL